MSKFSSPGPASQAHPAYTEEVQVSGDDSKMSSGSAPNRPVYSIGAVADMVGVPAATLRTWQERYSIVVPERSAGGHRLYTRDQVEYLRFLAEQVAAGLSPADAHRLLRDRLAEGSSLWWASGGDGDALSILLAVHDPFAAEFAEYFLRTEGYAVTVARDGQQGLAIAADGGTNLAVVDLLISGGRGLELCEQLSADHGVPVVAISALESRDDALRAGAAAFLLKPVEPLQLVSTIRDLLGRSAFLNRTQH